MFCWLITYTHIQKSTWIINKLPHEFSQNEHPYITTTPIKKETNTSISKMLLIALPTYHLHPISWLLSPSVSFIWYKNLYKKDPINCFILLFPFSETRTDKSRSGVSQQTRWLLLCHFHCLLAWMDFSFSESQHKWSQWGILSSPVSWKAEWLYPSLPTLWSLDTLNIWCTKKIIPSTYYVLTRIRFSVWNREKKLTTTYKR